MTLSKGSCDLGSEDFVFEAYDSGFFVEALFEEFEFGLWGWRWEEGDAFT